MVICFHREFLVLSAAVSTMVEVDLLQPRSDLGTLFGPECYHYDGDGPDMPYIIGYSTRARQLV